MENRFILIAKDIKTGKEKKIETFDSKGWINADVDETEEISFSEFCNIIKQYLDDWEEN